MVAMFAQFAKIAKVAKILQTDENANINIVVRIAKIFKMPKLP